ncbi:MAG TPA: endonuclease Q family protein [Candidatus Bipolaricaulota bacterium]|nr:endonuclease Q family protein [Candidatus Bipolaricaulota bacterium]
MKIIADLHLHSKYSRATSKEMDILNLSERAKIKGIDLIATGDFCHPAYFKELKVGLVDNGLGIFTFKGDLGEKKTHFLLSNEISCIYKKNDKTRRIHILLFAPTLEAVGKLNERLDKMGFNIKSDGRPILGLDAKELAKMALDINEKFIIAPAHIWTPWFSLFGSKSGFDSIEECFEELSPNIFAAETGLSSDPAMNWRLSALDRITLISNGDSHSPANLGREANVFELNDFSYDEIYNLLKNKDKKKFLYTVEFYPQEGKYHYDGHADCKTSFSPAETKKLKGICPVCKKPLTLGVDYRVDELADRPPGFTPANAIPYKSLVPLAEIIAECFQVKSKTKKVAKVYDDLINNFGSEFNVLLESSIDDLKKENELLAEAVNRVRTGNLSIKPGYDGVYGQVKIFDDQDIKKFAPKQETLL